MIDSESGSGTIGWKWWRWRAPIAALLPPLLFLVLRPESFGLAPNHLDPFFYLAYAINFDDIMREVGGGRYFVTRWTVFMPGRLATEVAGPIVGRLLLRWCVASGILVSLWRLGRRWSWTASSELLVGVVVLTTPMFARSFLTDYVEWFVVSLGIIIVCECLRCGSSVWRSIAIGVLGASVLIANVYGGPMCVGPVAVYLLRGAWRDPMASARRFAVVAASGIAVIVFGFLLFRWRYGIPNVYQPTYDFMKVYAGIHDLWKSPRLEWMLSYGWIYMPIVLLAAIWLLPQTRRLFAQFGGVATLSALVLVQYVWQWIDQFVRDGVSLEVPYYWSMIYPTFAVLLAAALGGLLTRRWQTIAFLAVWLAVLVQSRLFHFRSPGGWVFVSILVVSTVALVFLVGRRPTVGAIGLGALMLLLQVSPPKYDPSPYYPINSNPLYDQIFFNPNSVAVRGLETAVWLERELDLLPSDERLHFLAGGDEGMYVIGIYAPHVTGRWLKSGADGTPDEQAWSAIRAGLVKHLAIVGPPDFVSRALTSLRAQTTGVLRDVTHAAGLGYRMAVVDMTAPIAALKLQPADLQSLTGTTSGVHRTAKVGVDEPGFVMFGPYIALGDRRYKATVHYRCAESSGSDCGFFDVTRSRFELGRQVSVAPVSTIPLKGTSSQLESVSNEFQGSPTDRWEFRVWWDGEAAIEIERVVVESLEAGSDAVEK